MASIELTNASPVSAPLSVALRNIFITLALTISTFAITGYLWRQTGYEMLIVTMGWPHVILGFLFYLGRVLRGEPGSRPSFLLLAAATLTLWVIHYHYPITGLIYLYFLFHLFRDEIFVYLQTRARHRANSNVYAVAGLGPLILLLLLIPQQQNFRQDIRRVEFDAGQISSSLWTLIPFQPVTASKGREFYFYVQAPLTAGVETFVTYGTNLDIRHDGALFVGDERWSDAQDLLFIPQYGEGEPGAAGERMVDWNNVRVWLTGGHKVGQTFVAEDDNLSGIWLPIRRVGHTSDDSRFALHLASPPLLPYSGPVRLLRDALLVILSAIVLWRLIPRSGQNKQLWVYLAVLAGSFALTQNVLRHWGNAGYPFPLIFQFAVVFHYWSWYVFSFDKLRASPAPANLPPPKSMYDRLLSYLRDKRYFTLTVIGLNLISAVGVLWYYQISGGSVLRYVFDYSYFLYFLVFHVTFSFRPRLRFRRAVPTST
jgi:hypothetical protein